MDFQQEQIKALNREVRMHLGLTGTLEEELARVEETYNYLSVLINMYSDLKLNDTILPALKKNIINLYKYE